MAQVLSGAECASLVALYGDANRFRSQIIMERYRFGIGDYKYFAHPLPEIVTSLRTHAYPHLAEVANHWAEVLGEERARFPAEHAAFLNICHKAGQTKPTPSGLGRRRVPVGRAAAAGAIQRRGGRGRSGTGDYFHDALPPGERHARLLPREYAARGESCAPRHAVHAGDYLSRREMTRRGIALAGGKRDAGMAHRFRVKKFYSWWPPSSRTMEPTKFLASPKSMSVLSR